MISLICGIRHTILNFLSSVSPQQQFEVTDRPVLQPCVNFLSHSKKIEVTNEPVLQLSFIQQTKENTFLRHEGRWTQKMQREEKPWAQFWLLFLCFFSPLEPALCKLGQPGGLSVSPEVLTLVLGHSFVLFSQAFPFFVF